MSRPPIVHSYSPRKELLRRAVLWLVALTALVAISIGGLFAFRTLSASTAPDAPLEERVVRVDVQPEG
jgi:hypothetical protein